ncbi:3-keto-5-aminohexanoate cleavage protein [Streptomyces sp. CRN 30]|uniref:3-keto-5-aminohexanoate cleavage protein n=1 Tax=Streptomyces sp. CRN 30 TaxID=3075613 RepID=UPI0039C48A35
MPHPRAWTRGVSRRSTGRGMGMGMMQVCLNGDRGAGDDAAVPLSPGDMADSAARAVAAGASEVHVHPRTPCGAETLAAELGGGTRRARKGSLRPRHPHRPGGHAVPAGRSAGSHARLVAEGLVRYGRCRRRTS